MIKKILYKYFIKYKRYIFRKEKRKKGIKISVNSKGYTNVSFEGKNDIPEKCNFSGNITIGYATTLGYNNLLSGTITIGKYCQLGSDVAIHATNHPTNYLSTYINNKLFKGELKSLKENFRIEIGNDVWVGHGVIIVGNVKIGNGAILAAGSVITKDVLPYSLYGGVPAKLLKKRFSDIVINEVEALKWWDKNEDELKKIKPLFFKNFKSLQSIYH